MNSVIRALIAVSFASIATGCAHQVEAAATPPPTTILSPENRSKAAAIGRKLAEEDRIAEARRHEGMERIIEASVLRLNDSDRATSLLLRVRNKSFKAIRSVDASLTVYLLSTRRRVGLAEIHLSRNIRAKSNAEFWVPLRYVRFGEDTGSMRLAQGKPKRADIEVTEIRYSDNSDAGYDD